MFRCAGGAPVRLRSPQRQQCPRGFCFGGEMVRGIRWKRERLLTGGEAARQEFVPIRGRKNQGTLFHLFNNTLSTTKSLNALFRLFFLPTGKAGKRDSIKSKVLGGREEGFGEGRGNLSSERFPLPSPIFCSPTLFPPTRRLSRSCSSGCC